MDVVCLSLGHNSSAILIRDGEIIGGYESERLSRLKSDSRFPEEPLQELDLRFGIAPDVEFMVGHWSPDGKLESMSAKHWNPGFIKHLWPDCKIQSLGPTFSHHDSHAYSALSFSGPDFPEDDTFIYVMDGFGTTGEHSSIYRVISGIPVLQWRKFGYGTSMGLFYQFTTGYLGMKQNQDEYKLLAFESYIESAKSYINGKALDTQIRKWIEYFKDEMMKFETDPVTDPMIHLGALPTFAKRVSDIHDSVLSTLSANSLPDRMKKIIISYFTQSVVEGVVAHLVDYFGPKNIILTGGLFYNVKINSMVSRLVPGKICVMPLAGDQGAALGLYHAKYGLKWPDHVYWGHRDLGDTPAGDGIYTFQDDVAAIQFASDVLDKYGYVNIVRGAMEFGPRALCHTSTLARADLGLGERINTMNGRVNEMPFAPIIHPSSVEEIFDDTDRVWKSLEYMIITRDYTDGQGELYRDAAHYDVNRAKFTGRPQIIRDDNIQLLSNHHRLLINTSFNYHGEPIVYDANDIVHTHKAEQAHGFQVSTVVVTGDV